MSWLGRQVWMGHRRRIGLWRDMRDKSWRDGEEKSCIAVRQAQLDARENEKERARSAGTQSLLRKEQDARTG